jgi:heterotetrameric sarcosine oxidase alpha subunit
VNDQQRRTAQGGRIDRGRTLRFTFDGRQYFGFAGDTLTSALLANGVTLIGRSFKYHRPRGILSSGVEEPNALFTIDEDTCSTPNIQGTTLELYDGLKARSQNAWPSLRFDLRSVFEWFAPVLRAGFYYKTFMGPSRGSWMFYEPFIRRSAGLGRATYQKDSERYEVRNAFADVLVIGSGPAGLAAAAAAAACGSCVVLVEQDALLGGHLLSHSNSELENWRSQLCARIASLPNVEVRTRTTALGIYDGNTVALLERRSPQRGSAAAGVSREILTVLRAAAIVYATGAIERPLLFGSNDLPGIMLASAAKTYLNRFGVSVGDRVLVATNNDSAWGAAFDMAAAGAEVTVAEVRDSISDSIRQQAERHGIRVHLGTSVCNATGKLRVRGAWLQSTREQKTYVACDALAMSGGWSPTLHLTSHTGSKPVYDSNSDCFVPGTLAQGYFAAGAILGPIPMTATVEQGLEAGVGAAQYAGHDITGRDTNSLLPPLPTSGLTEDISHVALPAVPKQQRGKAFVDIQTDVTILDIEGAHEEGFESVEHLKRYTTLGMGTDQGKTSNVNGVRLMAAARSLPMAEAGTTTFRPPFTPVSFGALAGRTLGQHFRPTRRSPLHDWHTNNGAVMIDAGLWRRAWYYQWAGNTVGDAYVTEMRHVRSAVGISDVSTLGKIDVQGPDAAEFLNRVYVNGFAKLPIGKARYGVMLSDDGSVLDDGTTSRFAPNRFFMTTTTAQAAEVMSWLEFLLQTAWTDLKVQVVSITDEWGGMSVAGPRARDVLQRVFSEIDVSDAALPYMGCLESEYEGVPVKILRLSFSGELAFEVYAPANHAEGLWRRFLTVGEPLQIKPYGLEALAALRIEKGHVAGLELDHRTTLDDLGLGRMASKEKAYVGRELRMRPVLQAPERWSLVGIECLEPGKMLRGGSILFLEGEAIRGHGRGYITSVTWSPELDKYIALGLLNGGLKHEGAQIVCAYPLKNEQVRARIVSPIFLDPEGARLRA